MHTAYFFTRMTHQAKLRLAAFLTLFLFAMSGTLLLLQATPEGLGLSDDSIAYIAGARSMLAGNGYREAWLASNGPVTHFPPGFSSTLAFVGLFGPDPLRGARFVNALLFGLNALLLGILAWRMTLSLTAGLVLAGLFLMSSEMLQVHGMAMSEPLFIFLFLLSLWAFDLYFEFPPSSVGRGIAGEWWWLVGCGVLSGMAYLTRYAGLALVAAYIGAICILRTSWRKRLTSIGIFLVGFLPWALGWAIRNRLVAETATNRTFAWHPITVENLKIGRFEVSQFLIPVEAWRREIFKQPYLIEMVVALVLAAVLVWTLRKAWNYLSKPRPAAGLKRGGQESREVISFTVGLFIFAYLASIVASMTMFDAATKFKLRILAPAYVGLFILLVYAGVWLSKRNRPIVIILTLIILGFSVYKQSITFAQLSRGGLGYASFQWYDSQAMEYLRELPPDVRIYTNEPGAVYLYTGRGAVILPYRYDAAAGMELTGFEEGVASMQQQVTAGQAVLALFDHGENIAGDAKALSEGLHLAFKAQGDSIYARP
ncbi:MAG TPA: phospholipid carrier-dependent glycosyltransferase [Anaerolineales bacterium]|nr:phospholipid carrier-dependent glycosyltransferase [Anaerolineales bacterium]